MKKLTSIILFALSITLTAQEYDRNILIEVFTNSHCPLCPGAHNAVDSYLANSPNASLVNYIYYHMSFPYPDDLLNQANTADASARNSFYGPYSSTPKGFFDGEIQSNNYSQWGTNIDLRLAEKSPVLIELTGHKDGSDVILDANVIFETGVAINNVVIHFIVVEDVIYLGRNGITNHKNVMREIITPADGESIQGSGLQSVSKNLSLNDSWNPENLSFIVFIQNSSSKEIYQSVSLVYSELDVTDIADNNSIVTEFGLEQNYPNPFNPTTTIEYSIPIAEGVESFSIPTNVQLVVYDILGTEVATLVNNLQAPGNYRIEFNGSDLSSGIYFYKLSYNGRTITKKLTLLK